MRGKITILLPLLSLLSSPVLLTDVGFAGGNGKSTETRFEAELEPCSGCPELEAEGDADYRLHTVKGALKQERFRVKVKIPFPSVSIPDATAAQAADVRVILSAIDPVTLTLTQYAECSLELTGTEEDEAVYMVDVRNKPKKQATVLQEVHGSCGGSVPVVEANDVATARLVTGLTTTDLLTGTFEED
ncbi:MAG: hypothetical protein HYV00_13310 [Deltaproteobacteria bacterium]|nr:hypothetical protein [Deltaproteobacteria bacterium]